MEYLLASEGDCCIQRAQYGFETGGYGLGMWEPSAIRSWSVFREQGGFILATWGLVSVSMGKM